MASATQQSQQSSHAHSRDKRDIAREAGNIGQKTKPLIGFWTKISNDWIFNLSSMLAYTLLMSAFPILLVLLAIGGFILGNISPGSEQQLTNTIAGALPGNTGRQLMVNVTHNLNQSSVVLLIVGVVVAFFTGSGLFVTLENSMGVIFKLRGRNPIRQRLMAFGMLALYVVLIPIIILATIIPATIARTTGASSNPVGAFFFQVLGVAVSAAVAAILFGAIYVVVPNRPVKILEVWKGTLFASALLVIYDIFFPLYVSAFLHPQNYGSVAGFAVVILIFFYYLGFILLLGAEINSWAAGQHEMAGSIVAVLHEVQAHNTTRGAAGPTAGMPQEDLHDHKGAAAMRDEVSAIKHEREDHHLDELPPKFAESGLNPPGYQIESDAELQQVSAEQGHPTPRDAAAETKPEAAHAASEMRSADRPDLPDSSARGRDTYSTHDNHESKGHGRGDEREKREVSGSPRATRAPWATEQRTTPLNQRQRRALSAVAVTGAIAVAPVAAWLAGLTRGRRRE